MLGISYRFCIETNTYLGDFSASCQVLFQVALYSRMQRLGEGTV